MAPGLFNARGLGDESLIAQYLNDAGCIYPGDVAKLERSIDDLLDNEVYRAAIKGWLARR